MRDANLLFVWGVIGTVLCGTPGAHAQQWELASTVLAFEDSEPTDHLALAIEGDVLALARCTPAGGEVRLHARNAGGTDQWEAFAVLTDPRRGFGFSLDLDQGRLAIGIRGGTTWDSGTGSVLVLSVDPSNLLQPVSSWGEFTSANGLPGDRLGHSVLWQGDTLFVGATGRSHPKGSGAVHVFAVDGEVLLELAMLQPDAMAFQLPQMREFGAVITCDGRHLAIASPRSGYSDEFRSGAVHVYHPDANEPSGWAEEAALFDDDIVILTDTFGNVIQNAFDVNELGREGLYLGDSLVVAHAVSPYYGSLDEEGLPTPDLVPACAECGMRFYRLGTDGVWAPEALVELPAGLAQRARKGWGMDGPLAFATGYDTLLDVWSTVAYGTYDGGSTWIPSDVLPALDACDRYNGPVASTPQWFARSSIRRGTPCVPGGASTRVIVELFGRTDPVAVGSFVPDALLQLTVFPVPAHDRCVVRFPAVGPWRMALIAVDGRTLRRWSVAGDTDELFLGDLAPGIYTVQAEQASDRGFGTTRLVVY